MHTAILQIIKVNEERTGVKDGRPWAMQDCECILLDDNMQPDQVGVLSLPKDLRGKVQPGRYTGSFALKADLRSRRIEAQLTGLTPIPPARGAGASKDA
ncbi:hypothetical protein [Ramlibacter sp.]|uniref:hypothetical protein n=1 Tax=Ramlibacter sp. TaxID=1917967 RepID=UPI0017F3DBDE|nr:hypothetical protein [Ramlibacter sp.]MBA2675546.1 hypothetical protein [Ramlibacter sp.]